MPCRLAAIIASSTTAGVVSDRAAKMPPVCSQRAPELAEDLIPVDVARERAVRRPSCPRSETPSAPRTPKPRSVKLSALRTLRPMPS